MARLGEAIGRLVHDWPEDPRVGKLMDSYLKWYRIGGVPLRGTPKWNHGCELSSMCDQLASYLHDEDKDNYYNADDNIRAANVEVSSMGRSRSDRGVEVVGRVTGKVIATGEQAAKDVGKWTMSTGIPAAKSSIKSTLSKLRTFGKAVHTEYRKQKDAV